MIFMLNFLGSRLMVYQAAAILVGKNRKRGAFPIFFRLLDGFA